MTFTERDALELRMKQIHESEKDFMKFFKAERDELYKRLNELDVTPINEGKKVSSKKREKEYSAQAEEIVIDYLKKHDPSLSVSSSEINNEIKNKTGKSVSNITIFMNRLMKKDPNIKKPYRGQYIYEKDSNI